MGRLRGLWARLVNAATDVLTYAQCPACDLWRRDPTEECPRCGL